MKRRIAFVLQLGVGTYMCWRTRCSTVVDRLVGKAQASQHRARHFGADVLVAIEMRAVLGARLPDVVE